MKVVLDTFLREINEKTTENDQYPVLTSSKTGVFLQSDYFNKQVASRNNTGYKVIRRGQFTYRAMSDTGEFFPNMLDCTDIGIVSPAYPVFEITKPDVIIPEFLKYYFKSDVFQHSIASFAQGSTRTSIKFGKLKTVSINLPTLERQAQTIRILDKVSKLIQDRALEIQKLDDLIKARFVEMFGDPVRNPFGLPTKKLSELGNLDRGRSQHRPRNAPELLGGPYPLIQTGEVASANLYITEYHNTYSVMGLKQSKMWKAGTLCITIAANIAQTAIMTFDACFPDSVVGFIPKDEVSALYIHYWFGFFQKILEEQAPQVAQKNINLKILSELNVIVPSSERLEAFENFATQIDKSKFVRQAV